MSKEKEFEIVEVPLRPVSREEIRRLETALLLASLFTPEFIELLKSGERLTWIDSLATAAGALAREKAGMRISEIAEELGKTEATIRKHLKGETKAGQIVLKTYEKFLREGVKIEIPEFLLPGTTPSKEIEELRKENEELKKRIQELENKIKELENELRMCEEIKRKFEELKKIIST